MSNQKNRNCQNENCTYFADQAKVIAPSVCDDCVDILTLKDFIHWIDDELFELELKYRDFQTEASMALRQSNR